MNYIFEIAALGCCFRQSRLPNFDAFIKFASENLDLDEPIQVPRMDAKLAEDIVRKWQSIKSKALGSDHSVASLQEVLDGNMLKVWTDRASEIERHGWFWDYTLSDVTIDSITISLDGRRATVEATIEEAGRLTDVTDSKNNDSYDTKYTTRYEMAFTGSGGWKITEGAVLKS